MVVMSLAKRKMCPDEARTSPMAAFSSVVFPLPACAQHHLGLPWAHFKRKFIERHDIVENDGHLVEL